MSVKADLMGILDSLGRFDKEMRSFRFNGLDKSKMTGEVDIMNTAFKEQRAIKNLLYY